MHVAEEVFSLLPKAKNTSNLNRALALGMQIFRFLGPFFAALCYPWSFSGQLHLFILMNLSMAFLEVINVGIFFY